MKKLFVLVMACLMIFSACSGNKAGNDTGNDTKGDGTGKAPVQGTTEEPAADLLVSVWAGPHADLQKSIIKEGYNTNNVTVDDVDYGNLKTKQLTSFQAASGSGNYDVVWVNSQWMKEYADNGYILPLDDYISSAGLDMSIYSAGLLDGCTYDGKIYGFPTYAQTLIIAYDSEVFEAEGQKVPSNVDELIQVAKYFKEQGTGIAIPAKQGGASTTLFSQLLFSDGGYYFDETGALDLTGEKCVNAAVLYDQLAQYSIDGSLGWHHDEVAEAVRMKNAPIGIIMSGLANQNSDPEKSLIVDTVKYAALSGKDGIAAASNTFWVWAVANNSAAPEQAFDLCSWLASPETEKKQTLADQQISAINALAEDAEILAKTPYLPVVMEQLSNGKMDPVLANWGTLKENLIVALSEIASTDHEPAEVLANLQEQMKDVDFSK